MILSSRKLGRKKAHRQHLLRNLATSLILFEHVETTVAKAKELKPLIDRLIATAKSNDVNARRAVQEVLFDTKATKKMFEIIVPRYQNRVSGFSRSANINTRLGDGSQIVRVELIDRLTLPEEAKPTEKKPVKRVRKTKEVKDEASK